MARRRRGRWLLWIPALAAIALAVYLALTNLVFVVRSVGVNMEQNSRFSPESVAQLAGIRLGTRMDSVDEIAISQRIADTGWLELTGIERQYPNRLVLNVRVRKPAALISHVGTLLVTDADCVVIEQLGEKPDYPGCVYVTDVDVSFQKVGRRLTSYTANQIDALSALLNGFQRVACQQLVDTVSVDDPLSMINSSVNGVQVELGDSERIVDKLDWMQAVLNDLIQRGESFGTLNVTSATHADYAPRQ